MIIDWQAYPWHGAQSFNLGLGLNWTSSTEVRPSIDMDSMSLHTRAATVGLCDRDATVGLPDKDSILGLHDRDSTLGLHDRSITAKVRTK